MFKGGSAVFRRAVGTGVLTTLALATSVAAVAQDNQDDAVLVLPDIEVFGTTPLLGSGVPIDKVPSNAKSISRETIDNTQANSITDLLNQSVGSAAVTDAQNNPYQRVLQYRGYTASPLLGEPIGLAIYQNGVRINEPFGDVIQWDLVPEVALREIQLVNSNPAFGLNALGGAIAMRLHDGNSFQGVGAEASGGYFNRVGADLQAGGRIGMASGYIAAEYDEEDGWRNDSPSDLRRLFADVGVDGDAAGVHFNVTYADTDLTGNGLSPVELLEQNRRAIFTSPDNTQNELFLGAGQGYFDVTDTVSLQTNAYFRRLIRTTLNGDETEAEGCEFDNGVNEAAFIADVNAAGLNPGGFAADELLCSEVEDTVVNGDFEAELILDQSGQAVPAFAATHGALNTSSTMTTGYGFGVQAVVDEELFDRDNQFTFGATIDMGETRFHSESGIGFLNLDRSVTPGPSPIENTAVFEVESDTFVIDSGIERGDVGPVRVVAKNDYYGVFLTDTLSVTDNLAVTFSGRYNIAEIELIDELDSYFPRNSTLDGKHRFSRFNPAGGVTYTLPEARTTFFAGYAEANRAPSPAELTCADPAAPCRLPNSFVADPPLEQVVSRTIEVGARGNLPSSWLNDITSLNWSLGIFRAENEDDILFVSAGPGLGTGFFRNVGDTRRQGVEIGVGGDAGWANWYVNYSFIESTFQETFVVTSENHPNAVNDQITVGVGDHIPGIPQHNFGIGFDFEILDGWRIGPSLITKSGVYFRGDEANLLEKTDGYAVVNLNTSYRLGERVEIFGRVENLLNTDYETFGVLGETGDEVPITELPGGVTNPRFLSPGQPFAAFIGVRIRLN